MKTALLILGLLVGLLVLLALVTYGVGAFLPADHIAVGERVIAAPIEAVAARIREVENQPEWRHGVKSIEIVQRAPEELRYREIGANGTILFRFREEERDRRFESTIADDALPFGGRWLITLDPANGGTRVRIREEGLVRPPIFRALSRFVFGPHATLARYLADLESVAAGK